MEFEWQWGLFNFAVAQGVWNRGRSFLPTALPLPFNQENHPTVSKTRGAYISLIIYASYIFLEFPSIRSGLFWAYLRIRPLQKNYRIFFHVYTREMFIWRNEKEIE